MVTAHRRADESDCEDDLVPGGEGDGFEDFSAEERCEHERDGEDNVARARDVRAIFGWHCFGEESIETDTKRCKWNCHEEGEDDDCPDLSLRFEEPGQKDKREKTGAIKNRRPKDCMTCVAFFYPAAGGDGKDEVDDGGHRAD